MSDHIRVLMTHPHDGHAPKETCLDCQAADGVMSKAQQAAEERYPALQPDAEELTYPRSALRDFRRGAFISGWEQALPENPDPAVIEAMARGLVVEAMGEEGGRAWDAPGDGGRQSWINKARAAYAALRGAMQ